VKQPGIWTQKSIADDKVAMHYSKEQRSSTRCLGQAPPLVPLTEIGQSLTRFQAPIRAMTVGMDVHGKIKYFNGVQVVASSNPAAPTNGIKHLGQSKDWPFCFLEARLEAVARCIAVAGILSLSPSASGLRANLNVRQPSGQPQRAEEIDPFGTAQAGGFGTGAGQKVAPQQGAETGFPLKVGQGGMGKRYRDRRSRGITSPARHGRNRKTSAASNSAVS
jgi:hypothetical protein